MIQASRVGAVVMAIGLSLALAGGASAQQPQPMEQQPVEVTDDLLERFVQVYPVVVNIAQTAQTQLAAAENPEAAQGIQAQAQQMIAQTLAEGDLTVTEYEAVVLTLNEDEELRAKFERMLEASLEDGGF